MVNQLSKQQTKTRRLLIDAAIELILEKGYEKLTVTAITDKADYGRWVFYQYFKNKDDIIYAITTQWITLITNAAIMSVQHLEPPKREYMMWRTTFEKIHEQRIFLRQLQPVLWGTLQIRLTEFLIQDVLQDLENGQMSFSSNIPLEMASRMHIGAMIQFIEPWIINHDIVDFDYITDNFFRFVFNEDPPQFD